MKVRFTADFDWDVPEFKGRVTVFRPAGFEGHVTRTHAEAAIAAGKALEITDGTDDRGGAAKAAIGSGKARRNR